MTQKNPEYDFKWCPGCGDFGVRRALEMALEKRIVEREEPPENNVVVAGIGCSGNMVHLLEGRQPYGIHGLHGRSLPLSMGIKMGNPDLNVVVVAGDGDFLGIGMEHISPQAARNLDVTVVIMDNAVYGLTKGQSSPTTDIDQITSSTPFGKAEQSINPLKLYMSLGVSFVASTISTKVKDMAQLMYEGMEHRGFSIVHVQSPCTEYHNTFEILKGNVKKGIAPMAWDIDDDHDPSDESAATRLTEAWGVPLGLIYRDDSRLTLDQKIVEVAEKAKHNSPEELLASYVI